MRTGCCCGCGNLKACYNIPASFDQVPFGVAIPREAEVEIFGQSYVLKSGNYQRLSVGCGVWFDSDVFSGSPTQICGDDFWFRLKFDAWSPPVTAPNSNITMQISTFHPGHISTPFFAHYQLFTPNAVFCPGVEFEMKKINDPGLQVCGQPFPPTIIAKALG